MEVEVRLTGTVAEMQTALARLATPLPLESPAVSRTGKVDQVVHPLSRKRSPTTFSQLDIPIGTTLTCRREPRFSVTTADDRSDVHLEGQRMKISNAAIRLGCRGSGFFEFELNGETLSDRRFRMENDGTYGL